MKNILYLSLVDWFWIKQRPQHISYLLSQHNRIVYFCRMPWKKSPNISVSDELNNNEINQKIIVKNENMKIIRKRGIPKDKRNKYIKKLNLSMFQRYLLKLDNINRFDVIVVTHPNQYEIIPNKFLNEKVFIYDCMDNYKCWPGCDKKGLIENEKKIIKISKSIIVSSGELYENMLEYDFSLKDKTYVINNGVDIKNFDNDNLKKKNEVNIFRDSYKKKIGYIGTISTWLDLGLLKSVALKHQELDFYIIGPIESGVNVNEYKDVNNIIFTGSQPYYSIPNILNKLNVAIMPFKKIDLIESVNPVKIYEYLAMGKPVIALKYKETEKFGKLIYTYASEDEFESILDLAIRDSNRCMENRIKFAKANSWEERARKFNELINKK